MDDECGGVSIVYEGKREDVRGHNERDTFGERAKCSG